MAPEDEGKWDLKKIATLVGLVIALFTAVWGIYQFAENEYAKQAKVDLLEIRLEQEILSDRQVELQKRIWLLEDRYEGQTIPSHIRDEIRQLKIELDTTTTKLRSIGGAP